MPPEVQIMCIFFMNKQLKMYKIQFELNACALLLKPAHHLAHDLLGNMQMTVGYGFFLLQFAQFNEENIDDQSCNFAEFLQSECARAR